MGECQTASHVEDGLDVPARYSVAKRPLERVRTSCKAAAGSVTLAALFAMVVKIQLRLNTSYKTFAQSQALQPEGWLEDR